MSAPSLSLFGIAIFFFLIAIAIYTWYKGEDID
jgi:hypothetical protein